jgi:FtsP/CotA-like multicopper oxidase with cupredoxin domain
MPHHNPDWGTGFDTCGTELGMVENHKHGLTSLPLHYAIDIPGKPGQSGLRSGEHPSGLFWYHPHAHGFAKIQVHGGTTGAITIGSLTDYACPTGDGSPGHCTLTNTNVRVMALKDTELQSYGSSGLWSTVLDPESGYCSNGGGTRDGECQATENTAPGKWVFTINGIQFPTIRPGAGKTEIWRLINASNGLSYVLNLQGTGANQGAQLPFQVLSEDGVSILQGSNSPFVRTRILMMPSSRVEIAIPAPPGGGTYILHNQAVETGDKGSGDSWPSINLAKIVWDRPGAQTPAVPASPLQVAGPDLPFHDPQAAQIDDSQIPEACRFKTGDTRVVYFTHRFNNVLGAGLPPSGENAKEIFGLITGIRHANGQMDFFNSDHPEKKLHEIKQVWLAGVNGEDGADPDFPGFMHNPWSTICAVKGSNEPWELQNWTGEDHNFHIHQGKFTINPNGVFQYPTPEPNYPKALLLGDEMVKNFVDLNNPTYNDNIPVPRGQSYCDVEKHQPGCKKQSLTDNRECTGEPGAKRCANPGIVSIIMDFSRYEQVGNYVYHCHILEHEDGGMMAQINVICPPNDTKCAAKQMVKAPICKPGDQAAASPVGEVLDTALKTLKTGADSHGISN